MKSWRDTKDGEVSLRHFIAAFLALVAAFVFFNAGQAPKTTASAISAFPDAGPASPFFSSVSLEAKAAYVYDANTGKELYSFNKEKQLPLASLTKVMTAVVALSLSPEDAVVTIDKDFLRVEGSHDLFPNERWRLKDLLDLTLVESSNSGAYAIASVAGSKGRGVNYETGRNNFVEEMNSKARELNLTQTYFVNPTGLDEAGYVSGGYGSARDLAVLFFYAVSHYPDVFKSTTRESFTVTSLSALSHTVKNTNPDVNKIPLLLASKTGYTDLAGGNLVIAFDAGFNRPIVVAVLGSSFEGRFSDAFKLMAAARDYFSS